MADEQNEEVLPTISVGSLDTETNQVEVTFEYNGVTHTRNVNAVITDGQFDEAATGERVRDVARGVKNKIDVGAITNAPETPAVDGDEGEVL